MDQPRFPAERPQGAADGYAEFLNTTRAMKEALVRRDSEGFSRLVEARDAAIAAIGDRPPATADEKRCLYEAAVIDEEIRALVAELREGLGDDIRRLAIGRRAANAYYRAVARREPGDNSKFIDKAR